MKAEIVRKLDERGVDGCWMAGGVKHSRVTQEGITPGNICWEE